MNTVVRARKSSGPRVVIAHDYLTQRGGAERVVLALARTFPGARVVTSTYDPDGTFPEFRDLDIQATALGRVPVLRRDPRIALPVLASLWSRMVVEDADVVICSSSGWAHGVSTTAKKIVYCHNPARWLYQGAEYLKDSGGVARAALGVTRPALTRWDRSKASSADVYLANSTAVAHRIRTTYGRTATVVHPPAQLPDCDPEPVPGLEPGFLLTVGRPRGYKNTDVVARAVESLSGERLVAVGGLPPGEWPDRLVGLTGVSDAQLCWLYLNAAALVACSYEDFGLTPIEAYSAGTPALVLRAGGYLDTTAPGTTGEFVDALSVSEVADGIRRMRTRTWDAAAIRRHAETFSAAAFSASMRAVVEQTLAGRGGAPLVGTGTARQSA
jgi:glycosyltransferase involved in cell wall biosynthesis